MMVPTDYFIHMYNNLETPYFENIISIAIKKKIKINEQYFLTYTKTQVHKIMEIVSDIIYNNGLIYFIPPL